ncbi:UNVERIFIED_CONTAM: hypothetical protein GTU68_014795 [Idotea baltica]|nr:hypothetical protein [Idotea baltica]
MTLPDETIVLPGHGYNDILFSTIDAERRLNPCFAHADGAAYAASLNSTEGAGNSPGVDANLKLNLESDPDLPDSPSNVAACCASPGGQEGADIDEITPAEAQAIHASLSGPAQWVDVRDPFEFEAGHIPDTTHIPLSELGFHLDQMRGHDPLYISCRSGVRSMTAAKTLHRLGVASNPVNVGGGILAWQSQGNPIVGVPAT